MPALRTVVTSFARGASLRCPACACGRMSTGALAFLRFADACPACGLRFEKAPGEFLGAMMFGQGLIGTVGLGAYFLVFGFARVALAIQLAWVLAFGLLLPLLAYRHLKGAWVGAMYAIDPWPPGPPRPPRRAHMPQDEDAALYDAWDHFDRGETERARQLAVRILEQRPGDHDALLLMHALREREGG